MSESENTGSIDRLVNSALKTAQAQITVLGTGTQVAWAELQLVASRAGVFLGALVVAVGMILVGWILIIAIGTLILHSHGIDILKATLIMFFIHLAGFVALLLFIKQTLKSITFKNTRKAFEDGVRSHSVTTDTDCTDTGDEI